MRLSNTLQILVVLGLLLGLHASDAKAQNPFTFTLIEQQAPTAMFGSQQWADIDGDGDYDLLQTGNTSNLSFPTLGGFSSATTRIWYRQTDGGTIIQVADYETNPIPIGNLWLSSSVWLDADNDGQHDLLIVGTDDSAAPYTSKAVILTNSGGTFSSTEISIPSLYSGSLSAADVDRDGDTDILMTGLSDTGVPTTFLYLNTGGMTFQDGSAGIEGFAHGASEFGDLDNDGDTDLVISGLSADGSIKTVIYSNDGAGAFTLLTASIPGLVYGSVSLGDYDQDGDLDILSNGGTLSPAIMDGLFRIFSNDGGTFTQVGVNQSGAVHGAGRWADFDHDGDLDIMIAGGRQIAGAKAHGRLYLNEGSSFSHAANIPVPFPTTIAIGDYDNDTDLDVSFSGLSSRNQSILFQYENRLRIVNNAPSAPVATGAQVQGGLATMSWQASVDAESAAAGLTYAVRIGTQPGASDVMLPAAIGTDGRRFAAVLGNVYQNTSWTVNLPNGTYYWSVQAVDNGFVGSTFSTEESFTITDSGKGIATATEDPIASTKFELHKPYPNPFSRKTIVAIDLPRSALVSIEVYDALGRKVRTLAEATFAAGESVVAWDARNDAGGRVGKGIYFVRLKSNHGDATQSVVVQ